MLENIVNPLLEWFDSHARILPWREEPTPYRVWVSEIMLQQTRVEAVKPYFKRFTESLPDIPRLAACPEDKLLKLWEGLGYYNRVRNMQKAAIKVMEEYGGKMPGDYEALLGLNGIGSYTAGAVASIAFQLPVPAVDGNVLRVISRVTASHQDIMRQAVKKQMEADIQAVMPKDRPGDFNQSLMELGATICLPNGAPKCEECPLNSLCQANEEGIQMELPVKTKKKPRKMEEKTVLIIQDGYRAAIHKRPNKGLLAGLYELPNIPGHLDSDQVISYVREKNLEPVKLWRIKDAKHIFSHVEWHMTGYVVRVEALENQDGGDLIFVEPEKTEDQYPIPAAFSAYTDYLQIKLGQNKYQEDE